MSDPTLVELAARVAVIEQRLGITPAPDPKPTPATKPAAPTGLRATTLADGRIQLDWDPATGVDRWEVLDLANLAAPLKDTVTTPRSIRTPLKPGDKRTYAIQARNAAGLSPMSNVVYLPTPTPTPGPLGSLAFPEWYLTLPTGTPGSPDTVMQPTLATYSSKYFERAQDRVTCRVWHGGVTTSGSANPRSELREMIPPGTDKAAKAAWSSTAGRHRLVVEGQVNRLTKVRPYVVIGQIHDAADDVTVFRVEADKLWITNGDTPHGYLLDSNFQLGKRYQIGFDVSGGVVSYIYNDQVVPYTLNTDTTGNYFKAGAYLQSNPTTAPTESTSEWTEVVLYSVAVTHN